MSEILWNRASDDAPVLVLAHGAGAPMDSEFMNLLAFSLVDQDVTVVRFEFPYMQHRRSDGRKRPPNRAPVLLDAFREIVADLGGADVYIGGKSMGGRMASLLACEQPVRGVLAFGYPFVPPGSKKPPRIEHFPDMKAPMLICQGERDAFGGVGQVSRYDFDTGVSMAWISDGDHDFKPRKKSGQNWLDNIHDAASAARSFICV